MLNRRHLRVKVLQALYAFFQSGQHDIGLAERQLLNSAEDIYQLYLYQVSLLTELHNQGLKERDEARQKMQPSALDLQESTTFTRNKVLVQLSQMESLNKACAKHQVSWSAHQDTAQKLWRKLRQQDFYLSYIALDQTGFEEDKEFVLQMFKFWLFEEELLESMYEELNIHWSDDLFVVNAAIMRTFKDLRPEGRIRLQRLYKDAEEDRHFLLELFRKTILNESGYEVMVKDKAQNWEIERIALMDIILMKMALSELLEFPSIPVKVTLNEYIDLAKYFSTPRSNAFVNGILDKLAIELKQQGRVQKTGRGLIEK